MSHTIRDLVVKAAAVKAVEDAVSDAKAEIKAALEDALDPGDRKTALIDGSSAATITYTTTTATARITNPAAFLAWVQVNHPEHMTRKPITVDPDDLAWLVGIRDVSNDDDAKAYCVAFDRLLDATEHSQPEVRGKYAAQVIAEAIADKEAVDRTTGEAIPGVIYQAGGQPNYVTVRQTEDQKAVLTQAWQDGKIDPTTLALTPLAELESTR